MHHSQTVRQSLNYQSAEVSFGMTVKLPSDSVKLVAGMLALTESVEEQLVNKVREQKEALNALAS